ncbi:MAG: hypothetical protein K2K54_12140 [Lachnospiraceae bacterium]|nr:hypothetical protein [Lachnospiraceae bacterium]
MEYILLENTLAKASQEGYEAVEVIKHYSILKKQFCKKGIGFCKKN